MLYGERIIYIDGLKGLTIALVVLSHTLQHFFSDETFIMRAITSFYMPLFMFLSGFVSYKLSTWNKIGQRFFQLIIPFCSAMLLSWFIQNWEEWSFLNMKEHIIKVLLQPDLGLWFLWALFFINVIFLLCRKVAKKICIKEIIIVVSVAVFLNLIELLTGYKTFGYHWISWYFIFFSIGIYWRTFLPILERPRIDKTITIVSFVLFPLLMTFFKMHNEPPLFYKWIDLGSQFPIFYRLLTNFLGVAFFFELFKHFFRFKDDSLLCRIGTKTLPIYYLHFYCLYFFFQIDVLGNKVISVIIIFVLSLLICYNLAKWCKKYRITRFLILGENIFSK